MGVCFAGFEDAVPGGTQIILALRRGNIIGASAGVRCAEKLVDGWLVMGDMARMNPEGFLFLEGPATCRKRAESENIPS